MAVDSPLLTPEDKGGSADVNPLFTPEEQRGPSRNGSKNDRSCVEDGITKEPIISGFAKLPSTDFGETSSAEKYRKIEKCGVGAYGSVWKAENLETKEIVAIKATFRKEDPMLGGFPLSLLREITILRRVKHENIVKIYEIAQTPSGDPLIVMEFCQASLLELLHSQKHDLSFSEIKYVIRQVLDATSHLHECGILHRDLATKNILFNLSGEIKVCDFGISRVAFAQDDELGFLSASDLENPNQIVSLPYRAIELLLGDRNYGPGLDVWSVGCILMEILGCQSGRRQPFFGGDPENPNKTETMLVEEIFHILGRPTNDTWPGVSSLKLTKIYNTARVMNARFHKEQGEERSFIRKWFLSGRGKAAQTKYNVTENGFDLLGSLFTLCPANRISAAEALKHNFFIVEKPIPEWHAWHWALASSEIPRGDKMRRQNDERQLMKLLSKEEIKPSDEGEKKKESMPSGGGGKAHELRERADKRKQEEDDRRAAAKKHAAASGEQLPKGWSKHWSSSKQRYYYHDNSSGKNHWHAPPAR